MADDGLALYLGSSEDAGLTLLPVVASDSMLSDVSASPDDLDVVAKMKNLTDFQHDVATDILLEESVEASSELLDATPETKASPATQEEHNTDNISFYVAPKSTSNKQKKKKRVSFAGDVKPGEDEEADNSASPRKQRALRRKRQKRTWNLNLMPQKEGEQRRKNHYFQGELVLVRPDPTDTAPFWIARLLEDVKPQHSRFRQVPVLWFRQMDSTTDQLFNERAVFGFEEETLGSIEKGTILGSICASNLALQLNADDYQEFLELVEKDKQNDEDTIEAEKEAKKQRKKKGKGKEKEKEKEKENGDSNKGAKRKRDKQSESPRKNKKAKKEQASDGSPKRKQNDSEGSVGDSKTEGLEEEALSSPKQRKRKEKSGKELEQKVAASPSPKKKRHKPTPPSTPTKTTPTTTRENAGQKEEDEGTPNRRRVKPEEFPLPEGWKLEIRPRSDGVRADRYWTSPDGKKLRSMKAVLECIGGAQLPAPVDSPSRTPDIQKTRKRRPGRPPKKKENKEGENEKENMKKGKEKEQEMEEGGTDKLSGSNEFILEVRDMEPSETKGKEEEEEADLEKNRKGKRARGGRKRKLQDLEQKETTTLFLDDEEKCEKCGNKKEGHACVFDSPPPASSPMDFGDYPMSADVAPLGSSLRKDLDEMDLSGPSTTTGDDNNETAIDVALSSSSSSFLLDADLRL